MQALIKNKFIFFKKTILDWASRSVLIYTGITNNTDRRFLEHKNGKGGWYTKIHRPKKVLYTEKFYTKLEALKREKQIKGWRREKKLDLIKKSPKR